jgi:hypothetical protein
VPTWTETSRVGTCPFITGKDWEWSFAQPPASADHTYEFELNPVSNCTEAFDEHVYIEDLWRRFATGPSSTTFGTVGLQIYAEADLVGETALLLDTELPMVAPITTKKGNTDLDLFGDSSSQIRATLLNAPVGNYTIKIAVESFDAAVAGHAHGNPPQNLWGDLGEPNEVEAECAVEVLEGETSELCEVEFQADEISGRVHLVASVEELPDLQPAEKDLDVRLDLIDATPFLQREHERERNGASNHATSNSYFVKDLGCLQRFKSAFTQNTIRTEPIPHTDPTQVIPASPLGTYMSFNDFSLKWGGKFDDAGTWLVGAHAYHREGEGHDINTAGGVVDIDSGERIRFGQKESLRKEIALACEQSECAGAHMVTERNLHCEMGLVP